MIVDSHVHFMEPASSGSPYTGDPLMAPIAVDDVLQAAADAGVSKVVQVTPSAMGWDNRFSFAGARLRRDRVLGVFGRFDPKAQALGERLREYWAQPEALGVRFTMFRGEETGWLKERVLDPFLREAAALDVPAALFAPYQAGDMDATAQRHADVRFIADHTLMLRDRAKQGEDPYRDWAALLRLARRPNVWTKVSYFPEAAAGDEPYPFPRAQTHLRMLYEEVGPQRLIWGSNFPVSRAACPYAQSVAFLRDACSFMTEDDRALVLGGTFMREFSRIPIAS